MTFEGRRYLVTRGAIEFTNPSRIEPFFDVEAETRVRVPGQTYRVIVRAVGTMERLQPELSSDPPLPAADVLALLFSDVRRNRIEPALHRTSSCGRSRTRTSASATSSPPARRSCWPTRSPSEVGRVVEQTFGVDTFQLTPSLIDPYSQSTNRVNPSARVTIGKRISDRVYLTFSRSLSTSLNDQILLLEYDESDRLLLDPVAQRGSDLRHRSPREAHLLMRLAARSCVAALLLLFLSCARRAADVADFLGKPIAAVAARSRRTPHHRPQRRSSCSRPRSGARSRCARCGRSVAHLFSLGRFENVVVHAATAAGGVALRYELVAGAPDRKDLVHRRWRRSPASTRASCGGRSSTASAPSPPAARGEEMSAFVGARLPAARLSAVPRDAARRAEHDARARHPGLRRHAGAADPRSTTVEVSAPAGSRPRMRSGVSTVAAARPIEPDALQQRLDRLRRHDSSGRATTRRGVAVDSAVRRERARGVARGRRSTPGPKVRVVFPGDPLPADRRDELVPIAREGSADEDLLEDSAQRIDEYSAGSGLSRRRRRRSPATPDGRRAGRSPSPCAAGRSTGSRRVEITGNDSFRRPRSAGGCG